jgi:hypothetical protein
MDTATAIVKMLSLGEMIFAIVLCTIFFIFLVCFLCSWVQQCALDFSELDTPPVQPSQCSSSDLPTYAEYMFRLEEELASRQEEEESVETNI